MLIEVDLWDNLYGLINGEHFKNLKKKPIQEKVEKYEYIKMKAFHSMKNITGQGNGWLVGHTVTAVVLAPIHVRASGFKFNFFPHFRLFSKQSLYDIYSFAKVLTNMIYVVVDICFKLWKSL